MTIEPPSPPRTPGQDPEPPRGEMPSTGSVLVILAIVVATMLAFLELS